GFLEVALKEFENALKAKPFVRFALRLRSVAIRLVARRADGRITVENEVLRFYGKLFKGRIEVEAVRVGCQFEGSLENGGAGARAKTPVEQGPRPIRDYSCGVKIVFRAQAVAGRAGTVRRVEAE